MHLIQFRQILRDAEIANAISPVVRKHRLAEKDIEKALLDLQLIALRMLPELARL